MTVAVAEPDLFGAREVRPSFLNPIEVSVPDDLPPAQFRIVGLLPNLELFQKLPGKDRAAATQTTTYRLEVWLDKTKLMDEPWFGDPVYFGAAAGQIKYVRGDPSAIREAADKTIAVLNLPPERAGRLGQRSWTARGVVVSTARLAPGCETPDHPETAWQGSSRVRPDHA